MLDPSDLQQIDKAFARLRVIWTAMLASLGVYVLIANVLGPVLGSMPLFSTTDDAATAKFSYGLYGIAVAELVVAYFFRRGLIAEKSAKSQSSDRFEPLFGSSGAAQGVLSTKEAIGVYTGGMLLCMGLCEAVALCGLMGFIIRYDYLQLYVLTAVSLAALIYVRPTKEQMVAVVEKTLKENEQRRKSP